MQQKIMYYPQNNILEQRSLDLNLANMGMIISLSKYSVQFQCK